MPDMAVMSDPLASLSWLIECGADEAILHAPVDRFAAAPPAAIKARATPQPENRSPARGRPEAPPAPLASPAALTGGSSDAIVSAMEIAARCQSLAELKAALEAFDACPLKASAKSTVFADGVETAKILCIGEAPGAEEDRAGKPFVGRAGQLLDRMLAAINLSRQENVYITNVLNWRPPGNREPSPDEAAMCLPFLRRHIELMSPEIILLLGGTALRHVTGRSDGILRLRGHWLDYHTGGKMVPVLPTLHPAYLLRQPAQKRLAWQDLQAFAARIDALALKPPATT